MYIVPLLMAHSCHMTQPFLYRKETQSHISNITLAGLKSPQKFIIQCVDTPDEIRPSTTTGAV